ncbi:tetratricopeptide repeat protein [Paenibacillus filicis]|uniref:Tetratricopeptide repeat protein n=1 Tax=Paenibacillus filicis TaxID=669464 RepID=A0ABU9DC88_9BACL
MSKVFIFILLTWLFGNPFVALIVLLLIVYMLDRRFVGLTPSFLKPLKRARRLSRLRDELRLSPHDLSTKHEIARIYMEQKKYDAAYELLVDVHRIMDDSADVLSELGLCQLRRGHLDEGEALIIRALAINPRVKYGDPYMWLGEAYAVSEPERAIGYLKKFNEVNSSSCEAYYRQGMLYRQLGRAEEARRSFRETMELYRGLPKYKRRHERRWALLARFKSQG